MNHLACCIFFFNFLIYYPIFAFMKNGYNIEVDNVEVCPNNDKLACAIHNLKYYRFNRTTKSLNFDFIYDRPIDENVGVNIEIDRWGDGGWKPVPFLGVQPDVCKTMLRHFPKAWITFHTNAGVKHPDKCPIPPGNYSIRNYIIDTAGISIPFWNGRFRFKLAYLDLKTKTPILCYIYLVKITEMF